MFEVLLEALRSSVLVTGLVVIMMMLIETFNVENSGRLFGSLKKSGPLQVIVSALLGTLPGCMGGFAVVSLYTHRLVGFGALLAMMIATAGDESFLMLAMFPGKASMLLLVLFVIAVAVGLVTDRFHKEDRPIPTRLEDSFEIHDECLEHEHNHIHEGHGTVLWKRIVMFAGIALFIAALLTGLLEEGEEAAEEGGFNLLSEEWMYWVFSGLSVTVLAVLLFASDHFVDEHLWEHVLCKHLPSIFAWTFGMVLALGLLFHFVDISQWMNDNTALMILLAVLVGLVPESGPHLIFVTMFASGLIPFPLLLANSIVQDGHASLPLIADSKRSFVRAKAVKVVIALAVSFAWLLVG
ncbi:MAG: putative manganese transporter [Bacteroidales bacterium]|nr:putative manganese transporter [Bacteroidales bacterium]